MKLERYCTCGAVLSSLKEIRLICIAICLDRYSRMADTARPMQSKM